MPEFHSSNRCLYFLEHSYPNVLKLRVCGFSYVTSQSPLSSLSLFFFPTESTIYSFSQSLQLDHASHMSWIFVKSCVHCMTLQRFYQTPIAPHKLKPTLKCSSQLNYSDLFHCKTSPNIFFGHATMKGLRDKLRKGERRQSERAEICLFLRP